MRSAEEIRRERDRAVAILARARARGGRVPVAGFASIGAWCGYVAALEWVLGDAAEAVDDGG